MDDNCVFCKIVSGEIPAYKIWEDDNFIAFLNISPVKRGHTLVIPKKHIPDIFDMEDQHLSELMIASKTVANHLKKALKPKTGKIGVKVEGLEVPHVHVHLISLDDEGDLKVSTAENVTDDQLKEVKEEIKASI